MIAPSSIRYGFVKGGFAVVDPITKIGMFAYETSPNESAAKRNPQQIALEMVTREREASICFPPDSSYHRFAREAYVRNCVSLGIAP